jgi:hypothetical protein
LGITSVKQFKLPNQYFLTLVTRAGKAGFMLWKSADDQEQ